MGFLLTIRWANEEWEREGKKEGEREARKAKGLGNGKERREIIKTKNPNC